MSKEATQHDANPVSPFCKTCHHEAEKDLAELRKKEETRSLFGPFCFFDNFHDVPDSCAIVWYSEVPDIITTDRNENDV